MKSYIYVIEFNHLNKNNMIIIDGMCEAATDQI